jgi:Ca2+-binding EF-hand superfamily protein
MFLTMFGEKFSSVADPVEMLTSFKCWDLDDTGLIEEDG